MPTVFLQSEVYGRELFEYDTMSEALAAIKRLRQKTKELRDGVERDIGISV